MAAPADLPILSPLEEYLTKERTNRRVLSIQSHVVSGFVGNKCAVFPLQLHGYEVDTINSVQFSNHTQYTKGALGQRMNEADLELLMKGLRHNGLQKNYSHILTGYCGDASFLRKLGSIVRECRQHRPALIYVCDPVMGDWRPDLGCNQYYVPTELRDIYRDEILPLADVITPNAFELGELLSNNNNSQAAQQQKQPSESDCILAIRQLHSRLPKLRSIVCTSGLLVSPGNANIIHCYATEKTQSSSQECHIRLYRFDIPLIRECHFVGSGDLFSALLLTWLDETQWNVRAAIRATIASMQAVLKRTAERANAASTCPGMAERELRLVHSRMDLLRPKAEEINYVELAEWQIVDEGSQI